MRLEAITLLGGSIALASAADALLAAAHRLQNAQGVLLLDLEHVDAVTSSFVRRTIVELLRTGDTNPVALLNVVDEVREGVGDVLAPERLTIFEALQLSSRKGHIPIAQARLLGAPLEPSLRETLELVIAVGRPITAPEMHASHPKVRGITPNAWNNRLNELVSRGLLQRTQQGRRWLYETFVCEVIYG